jgi:hypothetical protein
MDTLENTFKLSKDHSFSVKKVRSRSKYLVRLSNIPDPCPQQLFERRFLMSIGKENLPVRERYVGGQGGAGQAGPEDQGEAGEGARQCQPR